MKITVTIDSSNVNVLSADGAYSLICDGADKAWNEVTSLRYQRETTGLKAVNLERKIMDENGNTVGKLTIEADRDDISNLTA